MENTFEELKKIMGKYEKNLIKVHDKPTNYYLNTPPTEKKKKGEFFGAVQLKKNYVALHLMPVYDDPHLLDDISKELKAKMQGKSCFNFKTEDKELFKELSKLIKSSYEDYRSKGKI